MNKMKLIRIFAKKSLLVGRKPLWPRALPLLWATALLLPAFAAQAGAVFTNLYSFQVSYPNGAFPSAALVQGSDGYFYGTASGTVFRISTNGALTTLYSFSGGNDGAGPSELVQGSDGYFYGTTFGGGTNGQGTVFRISTNGELTTLYSFTGGSDGANPPAALVQGSDGYFYGTTTGGGIANSNYYGGLNGYGTVFKISTSGALTTLYSFTGGNDGRARVARLVQCNDGFFYGITGGGGDTHLNYGYGFGTVFKISTNGTLTTLYSFTGGLDGASPEAALVQGSDGYFYGTTPNGAKGYGTVFKISPNGTFTSLYVFGSIKDPNGNPVDGADPTSALVPGSDGFFYGTTYGGGNYIPSGGGYGHGTVDRK